MENITTIVQQHYQDWEQSRQRQTSGYEYEKSFVEMWKQLGQQVFQQSIGQIPNDKNQKKTPLQSWEDRSTKKSCVVESGHWFWD